MPPIARTPMAPAQTDYLVIGSGIAGLSYAQGEIASVWSPEDSFAAHTQDTLAAGAGLCRPEVVETVVAEGPDRIRELIALGTRFSRGPGAEDREYDLGLEAGHSHRRILHASDATGQEIMRALIAAARMRPNIRLYENNLAVDLLTEAKQPGPPPSPACWGAYVLDLATGRVDPFLARATLLCTGGAGKVYLFTSNPDVATGDGIAMAYRAGVAVADMEFMPVHPTLL